MVSDPPLFLSSRYQFRLMRCTWINGVPISFVLPCFSLLLRTWITEKNQSTGRTTSSPAKANHSNTCDQVLRRDMKFDSANSREVPRSTGSDLSFSSRFIFPALRLLRPSKIVHPRLSGAIFFSFCSTVLILHRIFLWLVLLCDLSFIDSWIS
jgi:hypothetical protein